MHQLTIHQKHRLDPVDAKSKDCFIAIGGKNYSGEKLKGSIPKNIQDSWEVVTFNSHDCGGKEKVATSKEIVRYIESARKNGIGLVYLTGYSLGGLLGI